MEWSSVSGLTSVLACGEVRGVVYLGGLDVNSSVLEVLEDALQVVQVMMEMNERSEFVCPPVVLVSRGTQRVCGEKMARESVVHAG